MSTRSVVSRVRSIGTLAWGGIPVLAGLAGACSDDGAEPSQGGGTSGSGAVAGAGGSSGAAAGGTGAAAGGSSGGVSSGGGGSDSGSTGGGSGGAGSGGVAGGGNQAGKGGSTGGAGASGGSSSTPGAVDCTQASGPVVCQPGLRCCGVNGGDNYCAADCGANPSLACDGPEDCGGGPCCFTREAGAFCATGETCEAEGAVPMCTGAADCPSDLYLCCTATSLYGTRVLVCASTFASCS